MKTNRVIRRRYFRTSPSTFDDDVKWIIQDFEKSDISCFTSADYDHAFALYRALDGPRAPFKHYFDFVCMETESNKCILDEIELNHAHTISEVVGKERNHIEHMVDNLLHVAHTTDIQKQSLPSDVEDNTLRPYQSEMKDSILEEWKHKSKIMLQMPTGTGKTRLFVSLINDLHKFDPLARILIVTHRRELAEQTSSTLSAHYRLPHNIIRKNSEQKNIMIASIQKLSRMNKLPVVDYIIIDEAHHSLAPSYKKLLTRYPDSRVLGVTATPCRLKATSFKTVFDSLLLSPPVRSFINAGYLSDYRLFTVSDSSAAISKVNRLTKFAANGDYKTGDLQHIVDVDEEIEKLYAYYKAYADGKQGIIYAISREHAARIASLFNSKGVSVVSLDCSTPAAERKRMVKEFKSGNSIQIMVNVELFTEGFDCPDIQFVMLARPTRSLSMYLQQVGRALRPSKNYAKVIILDAAGLYNRFGLPDRNRDWVKLFSGEKSANDNYKSRSLGTHGIDSLMKEMTSTETKAPAVNTYDGYLVCDFGGGRLGVCDSEKKKLFPLFYTEIKSYAEGWLVGKRRSNGNDVIDLLIPRKRSTYTFLSFVKEGHDVYSVAVSNGRQLRFNANLRLIPTASYNFGGLAVYQHGEDKTQCLYTLELFVGATVYTNLTRYVSGLAKLSSIWNGGLTLLCRGQVFNIQHWNAYNSKHFYSMDNSLHFYTDGTIFHRIAEHPLLYKATQNQGIALCDKHLHTLCQGDYMETAPAGCIIYKDGKPLQKVSFVDYLCSGTVV